MASCFLVPSTETPKGVSQRPHYCSEKTRLQDEILDAIREVSSLVSQQTQAVIDGDPDFSSFDILVESARQRKEMAKYAWIAHVHSHQCE